MNRERHRICAKIQRFFRAKQYFDHRRKPFIWDNSISNDSKIRTNYVYLDPSAGGWELPADFVAGLAINPMNQAHLTRIALCRFQRLLAQKSAAEVLGCAESLCGRVFAAQLQADTTLI